MANKLELLGCTPEPLMKYLKALGVFRLVAEQADPNARLSWNGGGVACLHSRFDRDRLTTFFLKDYRPTPILAPWNGGSGFYAGGSEPLDAIAKSKSERLAPFRDSIARIRTFVPKSKPKDDEKESLLIDCRSKLSDDVVPWLDVCYVLSEQGQSFFPLLGTGGNDGRLEFTNNFMQRLAEVMAFSANQAPPDESSGWLSGAMYADSLTPLEKSAIGQFNPGGIGGPNGVQGDFEASSRVNPWDFVLMIEGALLFAGSVARRLGANSAGRAVFPFSVESVAVGYGSASGSEETTDGSRAELWLPLWDASCTLPEVRHLFAEGRAQVGRRQAKNAVEFALAVNMLGVDRGVNAFARYGFLKRNGLAFLAAPLGRVQVKLRPKARLLDDPPLVEWIQSLRRACSDKDKTPGRYQAALRQIDRAMFEFANRSEQGDGGDRRQLVNVLASLGRAERTLACGLAFCKDKYLRPLQGLNAQWLDQADDDSPEFRLAASLAGIHARGEVGPLRVFLEEVETKGTFAKWSPGSNSAVWSRRQVCANLAAVFNRRQMEAFREGEIGVPLYSPRSARLSDVVSFLNDETDDEKLHDLIWSLIAVAFPKDHVHATTTDAQIPFAFGVTRLLVQPKTFVPSGQYWHLTEDVEPNAKPDPEVFHVLSSGQANAVAHSVDRAARRLKSSGLLVIGYRNRERSGRPLGVSSPIPANRLLAALLFPLSNRELERIANSVLFPPEIEE